LEAPQKKFRKQQIDGELSRITHMRLHGFSDRHTTILLLIGMQ